MPDEPEELVPEEETTDEPEEPEELVPEETVVPEEETTDESEELVSEEEATDDPSTVVVMTDALELSELDVLLPDDTPLGVVLSCAEEELDPDFTVLNPSVELPPVAASLVDPTELVL